MSTFEKPLSAPDRYFAVYDQLRPPFVIQLTLEGDGDPEPERLDDALRRSTEANPGAALRIDATGAEPRWVLGPEPNLTVVEEPDWTGDRDGAPFLLWRLDAFAGPSCELVYARGRTKRWLVFRALHAVMDGQGTLRWASDVLRCLRGEDPIGHPSRIDLESLFQELGAERRPTPQADALHPFGRPDPAASGWFLWRRLRVPRALDAAATGRIAVRLAEEARRHGEGPFRLNLPTDLRYLRPHERTTGNLFSSLFVDVPPGARPEQIGVQVMRQLYQREGTKPVGIYAGDGPLGSLAAHRVKALWDLAHLHDTGRYGFSTTLSHLGVLRSEALSGGGFVATGAFFVPLVGDSGCVLSINGFDEGTEACVGLSDRFGGEAQVERLAELVREAMQDG